MIWLLSSSYVVNTPFIFYLLWVSCDILPVFESGHSAETACVCVCARACVRACVHVHYDTVQFGTGCQRLSVGGHCWNKLSLEGGGVITCRFL